MIPPSVGLSGAFAVARGLLEKMFLREGVGSSPGGKEVASAEAAPKDELAIDAAREKTLRRIMSHYDLRQISPAEWRNLVSELRASGLLAEGDLQDLTGISREFEQAGLSPHERIDLLSWFRSRLRRLEMHPEAATDGAVKAERLQISRYLSLLERLASYQVA